MVRFIQIWKPGGKITPFSVFSGLLSSNPDFYVSSLLKGSNLRFLEMAEWCNLGRDVALLHIAFW